MTQKINFSDISDELMITDEVDELDLEYLPSIVHNDKIEDNMMQDYLEARNFALRSVVRGEQLIDVLAKLLLNSNDPKEFDSFSKFTKGVTETSNELINISEKMIKFYKETSGYNTKNIDSPEETILTSAELNK